MSDYIPPELIPNILARLPIADVLRCTSVCRSWYHLITSSSFISSHLNLSISNTQTPRVLLAFLFESLLPPHYYLHRDNQMFDEIQEFEFPKTLSAGLSLHGSSNGLFCCSDDEKIILWNPSLKRSLFLTPIKKLSRGGYCNVGFGFIPSTGSYKIVRVLYTRNSDGFVVTPDVEIYDFCTRSWRDGDAGEFSYVLDADINYPAVLKGIVHWNAWNPYHAGRTSISLIASFDLGSEKFGSLMLPKSLQNEEHDNLCVSTLKDSLCLIHSEVEDESYGIYIMKDYGIEESWEKLFNIDNHLEPFYFRENGEFLSEVSSPKEYDLVSYDPNAKKVMDLGVHKGGSCFFAYPYVDSLFLIQDSNFQG